MGGGFELLFFAQGFFSIDNKKSIQGLILHKIGMIVVNMSRGWGIRPLKKLPGGFARGGGMARLGIQTDT